MWRTARAGRADGPPRRGDVVVIEIVLEREHPSLLQMSVEDESGDVHDGPNHDRPPGLAAGNDDKTSAIE
jgi:hypothetical protein